MQNSCLTGYVMVITPGLSVRSGYSYLERGSVGKAGGGHLEGGRSEAQGQLCQGERGRHTGRYLYGAEMSKAR